MNTTVYIQLTRSSLRIVFSILIMALVLHPSSTKLEAVQFSDDTFTDTSGTTLGSHTADDGGTWTQVGGNRTLEISNANRLRRNDTGGNSSSAVIYTHSGTPASAEYDVQADYYQVTDVNNPAGITGRVVDSSNYYEVLYTAGTDTLNLNKVVAGVSTNLGSYNFDLADDATAVIKLELRDDAKKVYVDGVERISSSDNEITGAGKAGVRFPVGTQADTAGVMLDNFIAYDPVTTTLGDGTDPSSTTLAPGGSVTDIDNFSLQTDVGTKLVTALTVTLLPTTATTTLSKIEVTTTGDVDVCTDVNVDDTTSNVVNFSVCAITVTTSATDYKVRITPKSHANMPVPPGASVGITATVTSITVTDNTAGSDTDSATVTVDNGSPEEVTSATASAGDTQVSLAWTNPGDSDLSRVMVLASTSAITFTPVEGTTYSTSTLAGESRVACYGLQTSCMDTSLVNDTAYYYKIYTLDSRGNWSASGVTPTGSPATPGGAGGDPALDLLHYRWRNGDGSEVGASYAAAEDTPLTSDIFIGDPIRLRMTIENTGSSASDYEYKLERSSGSCDSWSEVSSTGSGAWLMNVTSHATNGSATTDSSGLSNPGGSSFTAGYVMTTSGTTSALTLTEDTFTELEYSVRSTSNAVSGITYCFRVTNAGSSTYFTYTNTPQIVLTGLSQRKTGGGGSGGAGGEESGSGPIQSGGDESGGGSGDSGNAGGEEDEGGGEEQGGGDEGGGGGGDIGGRDNQTFLASVMLIFETLKNLVNDGY